MSKLNNRKNKEKTRIFSLGKTVVNCWPTKWTPCIDSVLLSDLRCVQSNKELAFLQTQDLWQYNKAEATMSKPLQ